MQVPLKKGFTLPFFSEKGIFFWFAWGEGREVEGA